MMQGLVDGCKPLDVGRITVDGHDIRQLNRRWVLDRVGVVAQRAIMWNTTILVYILYYLHSLYIIIMPCTYINE